MTDKRLAYPNFDANMAIKPVRDLGKWTQAVREIYFKVYKGNNKTAAINEITKDWDVVEKTQFMDWLKYYEENTNTKYKTAQFWQNPNAGYFIPMKQENPIPPKPTDIQNLEVAQEMAPDPNAMTNRRELIEEQRKKIISRLDSCEKLLRDEASKHLFEQELEAILDAIYQLKKKIHLVNKISTSTKLYEDMIIREANVLTSKGFREGAKILTKVAQEIPAATLTSNPLSGGGLPGTINNDGPGDVSVGNTNVPDPTNITPPTTDPTQMTSAVTNPPTDLSDTQKELSEGMKSFLDGLNTGGITTEKDLEVNDNEDEIVVEAQEAPDAIEVEEPVSEDPEVQAGKDFDKLLDQTFANVSVADVVAKLEDIAKIYRNRELVRQLAMVDMMLDRLGLASFFPTLSEVSNKGLESNNYILSRLEDILSRLRGSLTTKELDLKNDHAPEVGPEALGVKRNLQDQADKEKAKKQMRKELEDQALKPKPEIEVSEDMAEPVETPQAASAAPVSPPAAVPPAKV